MSSILLSVKRRSLLKENMFFKAPSKTHGFGVFSDKAIKKGEATFDMWKPPFIKSADVAPDDIKVLQIDDDLFSGETGDVDDFLNHSCMPNIGFTEGTPILYALRDIPEGEELVFDYSTAENETGWKIPCGCGAKNCRGEIRSYCDLSDEHQKELYGITLNHVRRWVGAKMKKSA